MVKVELSEVEFHTVQIALISLLYDLDKSMKSHPWLQDPRDQELKDRVESLCREQFNARKLVE